MRKEVKQQQQQHQQQYRKQVLLKIIENGAKKDGKKIEEREEQKILVHRVFLVVSFLAMCSIFFFHLIILLSHLLLRSEPNHRQNEIIENDGRKERDIEPKARPKETENKCMYKRVCVCARTARRANMEKESSEMYIGTIILHDKTLKIEF